MPGSSTLSVRRITTSFQAHKPPLTRLECLLIVFWLLIIATIIHFFRLKSLHSDREKAKRRTHLVWALPALSGVLLLLCITVDYALIGALKKDRLLDMTPAGTPVDGAVQVGGCVGL